MNSRRKTPARPAVARRTVALPAAVLAVTAVTMVIGMTVPAQAENRTPSTGETATARTVIPKGFLLYENVGTRKEVRRRVVHAPMRWKVSDRPDVPLLLDPCARGKHTDGHRRAVRTVTGSGRTWDHDVSEQLVVYRDDRAARAAVAGLRSDIRRCGGRGHFTYRVKDTRIGDEAFLVGVFTVASNDGFTVMRQGRTVALYARRPGGEAHPKWRRSQYGGVEAAKMARRLAGDPL
jgi:hypothetical protein